MPDTTRIHKPLYRVFHLNRAGGIERADVIEAMDDEDAIGCVRTLADDHAVELWDRARFVAKVGPPLLTLVPESRVVRGEAEPVVKPTIVDAAIDDLRSKLVH